MRFVALALGTMFALGCGFGDLRVSPAEGGQGGGEAIRIHGEDFVGHGGLVVYLGPRAAKQVVIESDGLITALTPQSEEPGPVDVTLRFDDGTELVLEQAYRFRETPGVVLQPEIGGG